MHQLVREVFRVENEEGHGPFHTGATDIYATQARHNVVWPTPDEDGMDFSDIDYRIRRGYRFGCASLAHLLQWFPSAKGREAMAKAGYRIRRYVVHEHGVIDGRSQLAFKRSEALPQEWVTLS